MPFAWNATAAEVLPSRWARRSEEHVRNAVSFTTYKGLIAGNQGMQVSIDARNAGQKNARLGDERQPWHSRVQVLHVLHLRSAECRERR